ncbi:MAG: shikimate dehydrogenase [Puniceicoccales bacterium]|jgi:shikimate dehydrogenase|nr:shikimate dehydrogenase [Puniceicoccales bacterium]
MPVSAKQSFDYETTFTLEDLRNWRRDKPSLAVVGKPINHSRSPKMHNTALAELSKTLPHFSDWRYFKFEIDPDDLGEALPLFHKNQFAGLNLTLPHKVIACDHVVGLSGIAKAIGAVNTLIWHDNGFYGHNTDGPGFARALREDLGESLHGANVVLLGAGGAARAISAIALEEDCRTLWIGNRDQGRLTGLINQISTSYPERAGRIHGFKLNEVPTDLPAKCIVINATSFGLKPGDGSPFPPELFVPGMIAYDTIYEPEETTFLKAARGAKVPAANGLSMLCWQGALALELWTHARAPVHAMLAAIGKS